MLKANRARFGLHVRETDLLGNDFESFRTRVQNLEYQVGNHLGFWGIENVQLRNLCQERPVIHEDRKSVV